MFKMIVESSYWIAGRGILVAGKAEGILILGEAVTITNPDGTVFDSVLVGEERRTPSFPTDIIGFLLRSSETLTSHDQIKGGALITSLLK